MVVGEEARIVWEIIADVAAGATLYSEAKRLNDESEPSPGRKYRGRPRKHGPSWCHSTVRGIATQRAYAGIHVSGSPAEGPHAPGGEQALLGREEGPQLPA